MASVGSGRPTSERRAARRCCTRGELRGAVVPALCGDLLLQSLDHRCRIRVHLLRSPLHRCIREGVREQLGPLRRRGRRANPEDVRLAHRHERQRGEEGARRVAQMELLLDEIRRCVGVQIARQRERVRGRVGRDVAEDADAHERVVRGVDRRDQQVALGRVGRRAELPPDQAADDADDHGDRDDQPLLAQDPHVTGGCRARWRRRSRGARS